MLACLYYVAYNRHFIHMKRYCFIIYLRGVLPPVAQCKHICMKEMMQNDTFDKMRIQTSLYIFANMIIYMHFISISQFRFMFSTLQRQKKKTTDLMTRLDRMRTQSLIIHRSAGLLYYERVRNNETLRPHWLLYFVVT